MAKTLHYGFRLFSYLSCLMILYMIYQLLKAKKKIETTNFQENHLLDEIYSKQTIKQKLYKKYYYKANLKKYFKNLNIYIPLYCILVVDLVLSGIVYQLSNSIVMTLIFFALLIIIIFIALEIVISKHDLTLSNEVLQLISLLNRWIHVKEDLVYAFSKAREESFSYPLDEMIDNFVIQIKSGMMVEDALNLMISRVDNQLLKEIFINLRQVNQRRGDLNKLLKNYEQEIYKLEKEFDQRNQQTLLDKITLLSMIVCMFLGGVIYLKYNSLGQTYYLQSKEGMILLSFFSILFILGIMLFVYISRNDFR